MPVDQAADGASALRHNSEEPGSARLLGSREPGSEHGVGWSGSGGCEHSWGRDSAGAGAPPDYLLLLSLQLFSYFSKQVSLSY